VEPARYWSFISYSSHDKAWARWLQRALETYVLPRRLIGHETPAGPAPARLRPIFRDRSELPADADLAASVQRALDASSFLIVVCSANAAASRWVNEEIVRFKAHHDASRILAVIVSGHPGGAHQDCFPPALRYRDETGEVFGVEPIAADLRPGGDGRRGAVLKLVAGMLGVGLDELVRRDAQRRARRSAVLAGGSLAGMAVMGALAIAALAARNEAVRQRGEAENLIGFMLGDLDTRLDNAGRLDLMDGIGPKALDYYARQHPESLDARSLSQRAVALRLMGRIDQERGAMDGALRAYQAAAASTGEQLARSPNDGDRIYDHAQSVFYVGDIAYEAGDWAQAERSFRTYVSLAQRLTALYPQRDDWRLEGGYAHNSLGAVYLDQGLSDEAIEQFKASLAIRSAVARKHPDDLTDALAMGQADAWIGDGLEKSGRLAGARNRRQTELALYAALLARDPTLNKASFSTIAALRAMARIDLLCGQPAQSLAGDRAAANKAEALRAIRPDDMDLASEVALTEGDLGDTLLAAGKVADAEAAQRRVAGLVAADARRGSLTKTWRVIAAQSRLLQAEIAARRGDPAAALSADRAVLSDLRAKPIVGLNVDPRWLLDRARIDAGDALAAQRRTREAEAEWSAAENDLAGSRARLMPRLLIVLRQAELRLGHSAGVRAIDERLAKMASAT
jgi:tetratricopeptide (TPR) repeat protein